MRRTHPTWTRRRALAALLAPWPAAAVTSAPLIARAAATPRAWTVAVVPQFPAQHIRAAWLPALERLTAQTGERFELVHAPTIGAFEAQFLAGEPDFVFLNPYHMVMAAQAQGYRPLLRDQAMLSGVLVVRADSAAQGIEALAGQTVAFPSPNALGASLYMRALLDAHGVAVTPAYVKTHSNVYRHVVSGLAAAGGGVRATLQAEPADIRDALRVLFETPPVASHPLAAHPRVPQALQARLAQQLLAWGGDAADAALLPPLQMPHPEAADFARDYAPLQRLDLSRFVGEGARMTRLATLWGKVWPRRLRHRALLLLVAVTLPTMLALVHLSVQRQEAMAMDSARQWVGALARAAASASAQSLATQDLAGLEAMLREIATTPGVQRIEVVDAQAAPLVTLLVDAQRRVRPLWRTTSAPDVADNRALQAWAPVGRGGALGSVGVAVALDAEQARLDSLRSDALVGLAVVGAIIIASFYALLQRALAPLSRLVWFARALPREPGARLETTAGAWELSELGRALNEASDLLQRQFDDLHASEQRTQAIVNAVPDAIIGTDAQGCITIASPAVQSVFGLAPADLIGRPLADLLPGLDAADAERRTLEQGLYIRSSGQHVARFETLAQRHGGTAFPVAVSLSRAETDGVVRYACMVRDLTEQRMAEEMLHLYSQALECTSNGVVISDLSMPGQPVFYANPAFYRITGYDPGEAIGRNCAFLQRGDTAQPQIEELRAAVRERRSASVVLRNYRKDGTLFFNELSIAPVNTAGGEVRHYVGVLNDVTERERARLAIAERSARLNAVFDLSPDGFVVFDREGQLVYTNRAFLGMTGWDDGLALQGLSLAEFDQRLGQLADPATRYPAMSTAGGAECFETMDLLQLSLPRPRVLTRLVRHNAGGQGESILYFRDVTHETEVDRMKSEFLTTAAHELRTPMVSVFGFTELLLNRPVPEGKRRDVLQTIHRQASLLINMVNELLDLARIEARQGKDLNREPQPLGPLVEAVVGGLQGHDAARPVAVHLDHADSRLVVDADKFQRALGNVLSNAFKYSPGGGTVTLRTLAGDIDGLPATGIQVADQGIGMSESQVQRVFERFYRADPSGNIPGTGLGMSLVKEIMDLHGGRAEVCSAPGQGTAVTLWFPQAPDATPHIPAITTADSTD